ncbi:hypothetical protein HJC23_000072 [Cyclotella cryptica]|uniref:Uncharacterized protein n=1 Tax=Cyclotella cryptica TaxID=29204 RepID=A0ABD3PHY6_9STRA|eukprot:CCRYP_014396-RA/>CCRYP_014396-RA protein AED:0.33 eAED:0.33 QI:0/-1/0/1/-1/1/1/0/208
MKATKKASTVSQESSHSCTVDEWIQLALCEYELIASLCNAQSLLGNAAISTPTSFPTATVDDDERFNAKNDKYMYDPKTLTMQMQRNTLHDLLANYMERIDDVRKTHALMKVKLSSLSTHPVEESDTTPTQTRPTPMEEALIRHIELSERVIRTVMRSPTPGSSGPCGVFFENGLVRTSTLQDHENNVVVLASLRASVSRLKSNFGGQ